MNERIYVAIDVEMTGTQPGSDEIIEVAAVKFRADEVLETFNSLVRPHHSLPLKISRLTGISAAELEVAPRFASIGAEFARFIGSHPLVGHSVGQDLAMLRAQGMNFAQAAFDTFELATMLLPRAPAYRLSSLAEHLGVSHPADHRALNDAEVCRQVFLQLLERMGKLDLQVLGEVKRLTARLAWPPGELFDDALRSKARRVFVDEGNRAEAEDLWAQRPDATPDPAPLKPTGNNRPLDPAAIGSFFAPDGSMGQAFPGYEQRPAQLDMALAVADTFNRGENIMIEAGTGTGKSMAYLAPAALFARQRGERVVVSTNTINLQDQLFFKDIPDLQRIMALDNAEGDDAPFKAALLKGRSNYLCLKRYHELRRQENLAPEEVNTLLKVQFWLPETRSGDRAELPLIEREQAVWGRINVTAETCIGPRCSFFRECYFFRARRQAESAHLLVVNHALLLSDLAAQAQVLPAYDHLIVDEAHNLEEAATEQLSFKVDQARMIQFFDDLHLEGGPRVVSGLLAELPARLQGSSTEEAQRERAEQIGTELRPAVDRARSLTYDAFNVLGVYVARSVKPGQYDTRLRLTPSTRRQPEWQEVTQAWENLTLVLTVIGEQLGRLETLLRELEHAELQNYDELMLRVEWLRRFATDVRVQTGHIIFGSEAEAHITWLTQDRQRDTLTLNVAPLNVAEILEARLFAQRQTSVLASATLNINGSFAFMKDRLGLPEPEELQLDSPFNYEQQALLYIPNDIPEPSHRDYQAMVEDTLIALCTATGGRTLALFTATSALRQTYTSIQEPLEDEEIAVLAQGIDGSRRALLERFKEAPRTVLLGTSSFWEGVDVVGDALSVLVIAKLPFSVPSDPVFAARSELFSDPFASYAVPQSILRFKQGFGRLIRSREDRGIVVVLDHRLLSKKYGQQFLNSLPNTRVLTGSVKKLPLIAARFLV